MKKVLSIAIMLLAVMTGGAQDDIYGLNSRNTSNQDVNYDFSGITLNESGGYDKKIVADVEGVSAAELYGRAMEALSDWTDSDGRTKYGIDYQDKETGTVIYKGRYEIGFKNVFLGDGWNNYGDYTLKVRCKDGKVQVTATTTTITAIYNRNGMSRQASVLDFVYQVAKAKGNKRKKCEQMLAKIIAKTNSLVSLMVMRLKNPVEDDF